MGHGSVLAGRYRLEDRLHSGADGAVWRAVDETLERQVGVRVIARDHPHSADMVDAARRAALVDDPRLARVLDVGESRGVTYIVTEYVQGRSLTDFLRNGQLPAETVRRIVGEAAQALDRAGARGLHHLKLSTGSVCIVPDGSIKLLGTAIESAAAGLEQEDASTASRADAVDLVKLLYAGLTGRWPGMSDGPLGPAPRVSGRAVPPAELVAGVPSDLDALCMRTLGPQGGGPRSPGELADQLAPWARPLPVTEPQGLTMTAPERPVPPAPRSSSPSGSSRSEVATPQQGVPVPAPPREHESAADGTDVGATGRSDPTGTDDRSQVATSDPARPVTDHPATQPTDVETLRAAARRHGVDLDESQQRSLSPDRGADVSPFPHGAPIAQPPLMHAPARPVERDRLRQRVDAGPQAHLWPTPTPPRSTTTPESRAADRHGVEPRLDVELLGDPSTRGVRRLDPAPPPSLGGPPSSWSGADRDDERLGPFMPPVPLGRPPQKQARLAIAIIAALVVTGLILSLIALRGLFRADPLTPTSTPTPVAAGSPSSSPTASPGAVASPGKPLAIAAVTALDPQGDGVENSNTARNAIDGDPDTAWRSERYGSPQFGGLSKKGVGLLIDLGTQATVNEVIVDHTGSQGTLELRSATSAAYEGSTLITTTALNGGRLVITLSKPVTTRYLVLWFTKVTRQTNGENRLLVSEVSVR